MRHLGLLLAALAIAAPLACSVDFEADQAKYDAERCSRQPQTCGGEGGTSASGGVAGKGGLGGTAGIGQGGDSAGAGALAGEGGVGAVAGEGGAGGSGPCVGSEVRCNDGNAESCSLGEWVVTTCSGSTPACEAGSCVECVNDSVSCEGGVPQLCSGNAWVAQTACSGNQIC